MPLLTFPVPPEWAKAIDVGMRYFLLNVVLWVIGRYFLGIDDMTSPEMLVMATGSVIVVFFYYLVVKHYLLDFPPG